MRESFELMLGPSRALCTVLAAAYMVALAAVWSALPAPLAAAMSPLLLWSAIVEIRRHGRRTSRDAVVRLSLREEGVRLVRRDGRVVDGTLHPDSMVLPWLAIVRVRAPGRASAAAVVACDCTASNAHRRLRVFMRWGRDPKGLASLAARRPGRLARTPTTGGRLH